MLVCAQHWALHTDLVGPNLFLFWIKDHQTSTGSSGAILDTSKLVGHFSLGLWHCRGWLGKQGKEVFSMEVASYLKTFNSRSN